MKADKKERPHIWQLIVLAVFLAMLACVLRSADISPEVILNYTPPNLMAATVVLLLLHALKCLTIFFPLIVLQIASGHLLPVWAALLVNITGILICLTLPYWIGRRVGIGVVSRLTDRYPRFQTILERQKENSWFLCFFLRVTSVLPGDIVTLYLGATHTPFLHNLIGGTIGILPGMILATLIGSSIRDPSSPMFWVSVTLSFLLSMFSALGYYVYRKRTHKN